MCYFTREPSITYALVKTLEKKKKNSVLRLD